MRPIDTENNGNRFTIVNSEIVAYVCLISAWVLLPLISLLPLFISPERQNSTGFQRVFGDLLCDLKQETFSQIIYNFLFIVRRVLIGVVAIFMKDNSCF